MSLLHGSHDNNSSSSSIFSHTPYPHYRLGQATAQGMAQYPTHVPLSIVQKGAVAGLSALGALLRCVVGLTSPAASFLCHPSPAHTPNTLLHLCRPARGDWVGLVGETFGDSAVRAMRQRMRDSPTGRQILADRPRVTVSFRVLGHTRSFAGCIIHALGVLLVAVCGAQASTASMSVCLSRGNEWLFVHERLLDCVRIHTATACPAGFGCRALLGPAAPHVWRRLRAVHGRARLQGR